MTTRRAPSSLQRVLPRLDVPAAQLKEQPTVEYLARLVSALQQVINDLSSPSALRCGTLIISDCLQPGSTLSVGDVYVDVNGFLKLRVAGSPLVDSVSGSGQVPSGNIGVTIA